MKMTPNGSKTDLQNARHIATVVSKIAYRVGRLATTCVGLLLVFQAQAFDDPFETWVLVGVGYLVIHAGLGGRSAPVS